MSEREYIIFCDESDRLGKYYSNFYGGLIVGASQYQRVTASLNVLKQQLNLYGEIKWEKVTERYLAKYETVMREFFREVSSAHVKLRVMFRQNAHKPRGLTAEHKEMEYFLLYYQFIKHAFGLPFMDVPAEGTGLRLYFDQFPDTKERAEQFKGYLHALQENTRFKEARIRIAKEDITEVRSHDHVLLQCLDIVLGSIAFRLNDKHLEKLPGTRRRGKRTRAKEALYKLILAEIRKIRSGFNIGVSTSLRGDFANRWNDPYRHWLFVPKDFEYEDKLTKRGEKKNPA